jgi:hypothetical protein
MRRSAAIKNSEAKVTREHGVAQLRGHVARDRIV